MKIGSVNKITAIFLGIVLLSSVLSSSAYAGEGPIFDLSVDKTSDQTTALPGEEWVFSLSAKNNSPDTLEFGVLGDPLDSSLEFVSVANDSDCFYDDLEHEVVCFLLDLAFEDEFTTDVTVRVDASATPGTQIPNQAHGFGDDDDIPEDSSDTLFLEVGDPSVPPECTCDSLTIKPKLTSKDIWRIKGVVSKTTGAVVDVSIFMPWEVSIKCSGAPGECMAQYDLFGIDNDASVSNNPDWVHGIGLLGTNKEGVTAKGNPNNPPMPPDNQKHFRIASANNWIKIQDGPAIIDCDGKCDGKTKVKKNVKTKYVTQITNEPTGAGALEVRGTIFIDIFPNSPGQCKTSNAWQMSLFIDSSGTGKKKGTNTRVNVIDINKSDFDGDDVTNENEVGPDGKFGTADDTTDGVPNYLNPEIKSVNPKTNS